MLGFVEWVCAACFVRQEATVSVGLFNAVIAWLVGVQGSNLCTYRSSVERLYNLLRLLLPAWPTNTYPVCCWCCVDSGLACMCLL
jgi:hypothetical protein